MNASSGQKSKLNCSLVCRFLTMGAEEGGGQNGGDFCRAGAGSHFRW